MNSYCSLFSGSVMKTKFLLALLTLTGLLLGTNSAFAATGSSAANSQQITNFTRTIAKSIDLDGNYDNLIESAINRALLARGERDSNSDRPGIAVGEPNGPLVNGGTVVQPKPVTNGRYVNPNGPIINGKVANPNNNEPIINGKVANPKGPIINGIIVNPNR